VFAAYGNLRGCSTVGLTGHRMMITGGVSSDSTSSIVIVSTAVMAPLPSSVVCDMGDLVPFTGLMDLLARLVLQHRSGRLRS
jgi:hypothetical protein